MEKSALVQHAYIVTHKLDDDGQFPNNSNYPLLIYKGALLIRPADETEVITDLFRRNGWNNSWVNGIYDYHHYHSTTHEVMAVFCGTADIQLGGPENGVCVELKRGDVLIIPAGVAHKNVKSSSDFSVIGAYPGGAEYDIKRGENGDRPAADESIKSVPVPEKDPVYGAAAEGVNACWK